MEPAPKRRRVSSPIPKSTGAPSATPIPPEPLRRSPFRSWNQTGCRQAQHLHKIPPESYVARIPSANEVPARDQDPFRFRKQNDKLHKRQLMQQDRRDVTDLLNLADLIESVATFVSTVTSDGSILTTSLVTTSVSSSAGSVTSSISTLIPSGNSSISIPNTFVGPTGNLILTSTNATISSSNAMVTAQTVLTSSGSTQALTGLTQSTDFVTSNSSSSSSASDVAGSSSSDMGSISDTATTQIEPSSTAVLFSSEQSAPSSFSTAAAGTMTGTSSATTAGGAGGSLATESTGSSPSGPSMTDSTSNVPTPTVVGSVVGGVAGLTVFIIAALLLLRRYKRKKRLQGEGQRSLTDGSRTIGRPYDSNYAAAQALMEASSRDSVSGADGERGTFGGPGGIAAFMNRVGRQRAAPTPSSLESVPETQERGFERLSGRKLPSKWSPGMEGPTRTPRALTGAPSSAMAYPSGSSRYPSDLSFSEANASAAGTENPFDDPVEGSNNPFGSSRELAAPGVATRHPLRASDSDLSRGEDERMMPGPARTPTIHRHEDQRRTSWQLTAPNVPLMTERMTPSPPIGVARTLQGRSMRSFDSGSLGGGARGSRFTEDLV